MSLFTSQQEWIPTKETPSGNGDSFRGVQKFVMGAGSGRIEMNVKEGLFIGSDTFSTAPFSVDFSGLVTATNMTITGGTVRFGKTSFSDSTNAGYILNSSGFYIGSASDGKYIKYTIADGTLTIRGTLNADDITTGTLTGRTVKAVGTGVASDVWLDGGVGEVAFYYGGVKIADLYSDTSGRVLLSSASQSIYITANSDFYASGGDMFFVSNSDITNVFNDNGGADSARWINDTSLTMEHKDNGDLEISGSFL